MKPITLEYFLRKMYGSTTRKIADKTPLSKFALNCFAILQEESEREAIIRFIEMRGKVRKMEARKGKANNNLSELE